MISNDRETERSVVRSTEVSRRRRFNFDAFDKLVSDVIGQPPAEAGDSSLSSREACD